MNKQTEALKLALDALKNSQDYKQGRASAVEAVENIEEALSQPKQEPWCMKMNGCKTKCEDCPDEKALAQPKRQPLTLQQRQTIEIEMTINQGFAGVNIGYLIESVIKATEAAHDIKEKNT